ncbi:flavoprotein subunit of succinate dehydrogenase/fumarate reductase [Phyllosticta citrichinensis]|uniref:Flavoprotein subunit of succinate dehydrogenase/fumarate reductase n=1 Tax=Phyllosticta citrichinensis TaxID=1130410 RepID=A0ABR1XUS1_9PEZI
MMPLPSSCAVLVVGTGNAGLSAAISAAQHLRSTLPSSEKHRILVIDKCPATWAGGNTYFTAGSYRTVHAGLDALLPIVKNVAHSSKKIIFRHDASSSASIVPDASQIDLPPYSAGAFHADLTRVTEGRCDQALAGILVSDSWPAVSWLADLGVRFQLSYNRQAYLFDGRHKFWGGLALKTEDGGKGLVQDLLGAAERHGVEIVYESALQRLVKDEKTGAVAGAVVRFEGRDVVVNAGAVILAAGGFEANPRMRAQYLAPGWDVALVRGTPYNTGEALEIAVRDAGAKQAGNWSGCHSVAWDAHVPPDGGDRAVTNEFTKSGYPLGIMVNVDGKRFVDEGVDFRNYTYARFGRAILNQPGGVAFQVWDAKTSALLRGEEYRDEVVKKIVAGSLEELAEKCREDGLSSIDSFLRTVERYNDAVYAHRKTHPHISFDPAVKDGLSTRPGALDNPKSNWALPLDNPPFLAVKVGCGITFTFGGLSVDPETAAVISTAESKPVEGLYAVVEMLGGLYYGNYPGGSGLTAGAVWGRRAGEDAARRAVKKSTGAKL